MAITFTGVSRDLIGVKYDMAIGFDDGSGVVNMVGYVIEKGTPWEQSPDMQSEQSIVAVASPNQIDRYLTNWPKATQGDWSHGEEQFVFIDPQRYHSSDGNVDVSVPGKLRLLPSYREVRYTLTGTYNLAPVATDGRDARIGAQTAGGNSIFIDPDGNITVGTLGGGEEIIDLNFSPAGFYAGTTTHIYAIGAGFTTAVVASEGVGPAFKSTAYFQENFYFITSDMTQIKSIAEGGSPIVFQTRGSGFYEDRFGVITNTATGLFISTSRAFTGSPTATFPDYPNQTCYLFDGNSSGTLTRLQYITGSFLYAYEVNGITFVLARLYQGSPLTVDSDPQFSPTLFQIQGNQFESLLDMRHVDPEFQGTNGQWLTSGSTINHTRASIHGEGRFIYIGWPGLYGFRIDLDSGGIARCGSPVIPGSGVTTVHRVVSFGQGILDVQVIDGTTLVLRFFDQAPLEGVLTMSDLDFGIPVQGKSFKAFHVELDEPLDSGAFVSMDFDVDHSGSFTSTTQVQMSATGFLYLIPNGTIGSVITPRITMHSSSSGVSPVVKSVGCDATLGRSWKATLMAHTEVQTKDGSTDDQMTSQDLLGNVQNVWNVAGRRAWLYVPSLTDPDQVERVVATLEEYKFATPAGPIRELVEGTVEVTFNEALGTDFA